MGLPKEFKEFEKLDRDEMLKVAKSTDPQVRAVVSTILRDVFKVDPTDYMSWEAPDKVDFIIDKAGLGGGDDGDDKVEEEEEEKPKSSKKTKASSGKSSSGGSADVAKLEKRIEDLSTQLEGLGEQVSTLAALVADAHFLVRILVQSNKKLKMNSEEPDLQEALYGTLVVEPAGNDD